MKIFANIFRSQIFIMFASTIFLSQISCKLELLSLIFNPPEPIDQTKFEKSDAGNIQILQVDQKFLGSINNDISRSKLFSEKIISSDSGGVLKVGSNEFGFCMLKFKNGDLDQDTNISLNWKIDQGQFEIEFLPEGLEFNNSVEFHMFYKMANLKGVKEQKLNLFYHNEEKNIWNIVSSESDQMLKMVKSRIFHFSRYALAHSE